MLAAWELLQGKPDLLMFDGQGIAHPRGIGIASQMGLRLDLPTIGVAKTILIGKHDPVDDEVGAWAPMLWRGRTVGAAVRLRKGVKPDVLSYWYQRQGGPVFNDCICMGVNSEKPVIAHRFLKFLRINVASSPNDQVLDPSGHIDFAPRNVGGALQLSLELHAAQRVGSTCTSGQVFE